MFKISDKQLNNIYDEMKSSEEDSFVSPEDLGLAETRYEILELIGEGSMKAVHKAYDHYTCRYIAFAKLIKQGDDSLLNSFFHEARLMSQLDHPNIMQVHDIGLDLNNEPFFTMDLKGEESLKDHCSHSSYSRDNYSSILQTFSQVCSAVSYAHKKEIIHLDLKPENIQVGQYNEVVICDWGLGTTLHKVGLQDFVENPFYSSLVNTKPNPEKVYGTPGFMSPEQFNRSQENDTRSDIFGLGCVLYFMLTLRAPFQGDFEEIKAKVEREDFLLPSYYNKHLPSAIEAIVVKALKAKKEERYASLDDLYQDIQSYLNGFTISAEKSNFLREFSLFVKRNKAVCLSIFISSCILFVFLTFFIVSLEKSQRKAFKAQLKAEDANKKSQEAYSETLSVLKKLRAEESSNKSLRNQIKKTLHHDVFILKDRRFLNDPDYAAKSGLEKCKLLLSEDPSNRTYNRAAFELSLIKCDLESAEKYFKKIKTKKDSGFQNFLLENQQGYDGLAVNRNRHPSHLAQFEKYLESFLRHCPEELTLMQKMIILDLKRRKSAKAYFSDKIVKLALKALNPNWDDQGWSFDGHSLKITGSLFTKSQHKFYFHSETNFLTLIFVDHLDVSGTGLDFKALHDVSNVKELNISNTAIHTLKALATPNKLEKLIIHKGQVQDKELSSLVRKGIEVVEIDML